MLKIDYFIHDSLYIEAKNKGWSGWGGERRIGRSKEQMKRIFSSTKIPLTGKALDLGCGEGHISRLLSEAGFAVTGIDISTTAIEWAKEKAVKAGCKIQYYVKDLSVKDSIVGGQYELIVDGNCLHCIIGHDRKIFLSNIYNSLSPKGVFFISSLCSKKPVGERINFRETIYRQIPSESELHKEVIGTGFQVVKKTIFTREKYNHINVHLIKKANRVRHKVGSFSSLR